MSLPVNPSSIEHDFFLEQWTKTLRAVYGIIPDADRAAAIEAAWDLLQETIREALPLAESEMWAKKLREVMEGVLAAQRKQSQSIDFYH